MAALDYSAFMKGAIPKLLTIFRKIWIERNTMDDMNDNSGYGRTIRIAAGLVIDGDKRLLLVRKRETEAFMQPGGKIEPGEEPVDALLRELREEVGLIVQRSAPVHLGSFVAPAANEPGFEVSADVFLVAGTEEIIPASEIDEAVWIDGDSVHDMVMAPLTRDHILPLYHSLFFEKQTG